MLYLSAYIKFRVSPRCYFSWYTVGTENAFKDSSLLWRRIWNFTIWGVVCLIVNCLAYRKKHRMKKHSFRRKSVLSFSKNHFSCFTLPEMRQLQFLSFWIPPMHNLHIVNFLRWYSITKWKNSLICDSCKNLVRFMPNPMQHHAIINVLMITSA